MIVEINTTIENLRVWCYADIWLANQEDFPTLSLQTCWWVISSSELLWSKVS